MEKVCYHTENISLPSLKKKVDLISPKDIVEYLDRNIIGQEKAKKSLAVAVYKHLRRINTKENQEGIPKSNILMQGSTGSGKTFLLRNLAKFLKVPFAIVDASVITEAGYKGRNVECILADLYHAANGNVGLAEKGIIYLDEFDKLSKGKGSVSSSSGCENGVAVQYQMLKMLEGCTMDVPVLGKSTVKMNTENILFVCGGAFVGIKDVEHNKMLRKPIGFRMEIEENKDVSKERRLTHQNFVEYGLIPEVVGRLPTIVEMDTLTECDMVNILLKSESSIIKSYQNVLKAEGVELVFEDDAIMEIAHIAYVKNTGARGLNAIVDEVMEDIMFDLPSDPSIYRCIITKEAVSGEGTPLIEREAENSYKF